MTILIGTILDAAGGPWSGYMDLELSGDALLDPAGGGPALIPHGFPVRLEIVDGAIGRWTRGATVYEATPTELSAMSEAELTATGPWVYGLDVLSPSNLYYIQTLQNQDGGTVLRRNVYISGIYADIGEMPTIGGGGTGGTVTTLAGDVTGPTTATVVGKFQGRPVAATAPTTGQLMTWDSVGATWKPALLTDAMVATANKDGAAGTASLRTLGTGAAQAAAGNDSRFPHTRAYFNAQLGADQPIVGGAAAAKIIFDTGVEALGITPDLGNDTFTVQPAAGGQRFHIDVRVGFYMTGPAPDVSVQLVLKKNGTAIQSAVVGLVPGPSGWLQTMATISHTELLADGDIITVTFFTPTVGTDATLTGFDAVLEIYSIGY